MGKNGQKNPAGKTGPAQKIALNPRIRIFQVRPSNSEENLFFDNFENLENLKLILMILYILYISNNNSN